MGKEAIIAEESIWRNNFENGSSLTPFENDLRSRTFAIVNRRDLHSLSVTKSL
jgi:hypothetical protein